MKYNKFKPILIGIAGDSATGKSTISKIISEILNRDFLMLDGDAYHKWERKNKKWEKYTHLNPKSNYLCRQIRELKCLRNGKKKRMIGYDHSCGKFTDKRIVYPKKFIIINGLHTLYLKKMREMISFKIYMDAEDNLKSHWKIKRDVFTRHKDIESVLSEIKRRKKDYYRYILPQNMYADMSILYFDKDINENDNLKAILKIILMYIIKQNYWRENVKGCHF